MPSGVLWTIWDNNVHNIHKGDLVSPSLLPRCPRRIKLERTRDYYAEPLKLYYAVRGSLFHQWLDRPREGTHNEMRLWRQVTRGPQAPYWVSGAIDHINPRDKTIEDYKSKADKALYYLLKDSNDPDYEAQLNVYKWLVQGGRKGDSLEEALTNPEVWIDIDHLVLHYVFMNKVVTTGQRFTDVVSQKYEPKKTSPFEVDRRLVSKWPSGWGKWEIDYAIPPLRVWSLEETEDYVVKHAPVFVGTFRNPDDIPPGVMNDGKDATWECDFCPVVDQCKQYGGWEPTVKPVPNGLPF